MAKTDPAEVPGSAEDQAARAAAGPAAASEPAKHFEHNGYKYGLETDETRVAPMKVALVSPSGHHLDYFATEKEARAAVEDPGSSAMLAQNVHG